MTSDAHAKNMEINADPCGACVVIADSLPGLRSYAAKIVKSLTEKYVTVIEAEDGQTVVELAKAHAPELVIMDVSLPLLNGIKAAAEIWHHKPDTKILFWTQYHREVYVRDLRRIVPNEAVHGYVLKNHSDDKLRYAILSVWFHSNPYTDPDVRQSMLPNPREMLSDHEFETLQDLVLGLTEKAISMRRNISVRGVQCRTAAVYNKLLPGKRGGAGSASAGGLGATANAAAGSAGAGSAGSGAGLGSGSGLGPSSDPILSEVFNPRARAFFEAVKRGLVEPDSLAAWEKDLDVWLRTELGIER